jgi:hypothetical protein
MAAVEMRPVNAWSVKKPRYPGYVGKYRDAEGYGLSGWFEREYKYTKHMIALNNGNVMTRYRFPKVEIPFSSPMHRWENLWFCGGWSTQGPNGEWVGSNDCLLQAVADGMKPVGFINIDARELNQWLDRIQSLGIHHAVREGKVIGRLDIGIAANNRTLADNFDILISNCSLSRTWKWGICLGSVMLLSCVRNLRKH